MRMYSARVKYAQPLPSLPTLRHLRLYRWHDSLPMHVLLPPLPALQSLYVDNITLQWTNLTQWQSKALRHFTLIEKKLDYYMVDHMLQVSGMIHQLSCHHA